jgi:hypothetical protein
LNQFCERPCKCLHPCYPPTPPHDDDLPSPRYPRLQLHPERPRGNKHFIHEILLLHAFYPRVRGITSRTRLRRCGILVRDASCYSAR